MQTVVASALVRYFEALPGVELALRTAPFAERLRYLETGRAIHAIEADMKEELFAVVQLVSTGEALMERRIAEIPASEP